MLALGSANFTGGKRRCFLAMLRWLQLSPSSLWYLTKTRVWGKTNFLTLTLLNRTLSLVKPDPVTGGLNYPDPAWTSLWIIPWTYCLDWGSRWIRMAQDPMEMSNNCNIIPKRGICDGVYSNDRITSQYWSHKSLDRKVLNAHIMAAQFEKWLVALSDAVIQSREHIGITLI